MNYNVDNLKFIELSLPKRVGSKKKFITNTNSIRKWIVEESKQIKEECSISSINLRYNYAPLQHVRSNSIEEVYLREGLF